MRFSLLFFVFLFVFTPNLYCQDADWAVDNIPLELKTDVNSVIRNEQVVIEVEKYRLNIQTTTIITVLNSNGDQQYFAGSFYSPNIKIKDQNAVVYDEHGNELRKFRQRDFDDQSAVGSSELYSDDRISYLDYTPTVYPYTIKYTSEVITNSTIFIPSWRPVKSYLQSVENSSYKLLNPQQIPVRILENNFVDNIQNHSEQFNIHYSLQNFKGLSYEVLSPSKEEIFPEVKLALNEFSLVGVQGVAQDWANLGKWQYDNLLTEDHQISKKTIQEIAELTKDLENDKDKARVIYDYVQKKTRYISVQLGIGGWVPMPASDVDELGYGDCKALTNYTRALLQSQGINAYYAVIYGGEYKEIHTDFASMQGNHVILNIPQNDEKDIWLECTSQTDPFNYLGSFTDNRNALLIKPDGGEIVKTTKYTVEENITRTESEIIIEVNGDFSATLNRVSHGVPYSEKYHLERQTEKDQKLYYKKEFWQLKNLEIEKVHFDNDRIEQNFSESIQISGTNLATKAGNKLLIPLNIFNLPTERTPRYKTRKLPVKILRGKTYEDQLTLHIPKEYFVEALPKAYIDNNEFGTFQFTAQSKDNNQITVNRKFILKDGLWEKESYENFKKFMNTIRSSNNQKAVISAIIN